MVRFTSHLLASLSSPRLWPWFATFFRGCFTSLCSFFHLEPVGFVQCSLRPGGATHFYIARQALDFIMVQGRWKDLRITHMSSLCRRCQRYVSELSPSGASKTSHIPLSLLPSARVAAQIGRSGGFVLFPLFRVGRLWIEACTASKGVSTCGCDRWCFLARAKSQVHHNLEHLWVVRAKMKLAASLCIMLAVLTNVVSLT